MRNENDPVDFDRDIVWHGKILRIALNEQKPSIKERTEAGGWKLVCHGTVAEMELTWRRMWAERDIDKEAVSTGNGMIIRDLADDISADLQPIEDQTSTAVEVSTMVELSKNTNEKVVSAIGWVDASKQYAQIAVICAARAGAEFSSIKDQCDRGEWMKVLKVLPVGKDTVYKYIKVAEELQARLSEGGDAFDLLQLPDPTRLIEPQHAATLGKINQVTGEQTLRQLYFDWGICKAPAALGGARTPKDDQPATPAALEAVRRQAANETVGTLCTDVQNTCINEQRCIQLADLSFLKLLEGDLIDALHNVRDLIKAN